MKWSQTTPYALSILLSLLVPAPPALAGYVSVPTTAGGAFSVKVTSLKEARFRFTVRQQHDFSCGSAALATLLTHHYDDAVSEEEVFKAMFDTGNQEKIRREGFSLLDMKKYLETNNYQAAGYRVTLDRLSEIGVPAIALINIKGYKHFVVVKGVSEKDVLVGDPAIGTRVIARADFEPMWNGLIFVILNKKNLAKNHFNRYQEWHVKAKAPLGVSLSQNDLAGVTMLLPGVMR